MKQIKCRLCDVICEDCQAALSHECAIDKAIFEKAQLNKTERERDKRERFQFVIQMTLRYLFYLTKQVVPDAGRCVRGSTVLDFRTLAEFNL